MKIIIVLLFTTLSFGCVINQQQYSDESMQGLASQFKDLSQTIDGQIKFGEQKFKDGQETLDFVANKYPEKVTPFEKYTIKIKIDKHNALLLLCDADKALMEDLGCNAHLDAAYWKKPQANSCSFSLDSAQLCQ